jgi:hypothetical protein
MSTQALTSPTAQPSFVELFTPKLVTVFREGYSLASLRADLMAGLTVAIVAQPLSMAIAIGSHPTPAQGLYTAVVGGFVVSALSGSRFQIGGPAGAFIVLYQRSFALTDVSPVAHPDGGDDFGLGGEFVPCVADGVDDVVEGFEDAVGEPVGA